MNNRKLVFTPALTPTLSARRGKNARRVLNDRMPSVIRRCSPTNCQSAAIARLVIELSERDDSCPLSPGERVRVRASVPLTLLSSSNIQCRHRLQVVRQQMRRAFLQRGEDRLANKLLLPPQLRIPKTQFLDPHRGEELRSLGIVRLLVGMPMLPAVEFDGETGFAAVEIEEVNPARVIAPELVGAEAPVAQPTPHELLGPSLLLAQNAGAVRVGHGGNLASNGWDEKNGVNARPHPGPLPQERENRSPRPCIATSIQSSRTSYSEQPRGGSRRGEIRESRSLRLLFPLPEGGAA